VGRAHPHHRRRGRHPRLAGDAAHSWKASASRWRRTARGPRPARPPQFDLLLLDLALPGESGIDLLPRILELQPAAGHHDYGLRHGRQRGGRHPRGRFENFVQKPWDNEKLLADIRAAIGRHRAEEEVVQLKRTLKQRYNFENIVGKSEPMLRLFDLVAQVAPSRRPC
jgi:DNA-binding NtrC family response regulator